MFSSLLRQKKRQQGRRAERTPLLAAFGRYRNRQTEDERSASAPADDDYDEHADHYDGEDDDDADEEDEDEQGQRDGPLLPVFSEFLDRLPIYNTTHSIRIIVIQRCETTLSWEQLRSPQVSQFLVKPIQQQILADHFSRASIYCLLANCLQFRKEGEMNPGNVGVSKTRALICELLAMRLLKEFSTRELIDALSYDFDPLQGMAPAAIAGMTTPSGNRPRSGPRSPRISSLEIAIRAQAKKFLAHPLVVQQLEAIWAGTIVFHSTADSLHRQPPRPLQNKNQNDEDTPLRRYNTIDSELPPGQGPSRRRQPAKYETAQQATDFPIFRRTVTLYDPHDASLFKLSRLRVPRYRQLFSTLSFAIMLGLFVAVLIEKSVDITALEVVFWFWSAGYMLDEIVGFSEQGFGLYIMSVWNAFDLGILLMFVVYYVLRLYGILMPDVRKSYVANMAYDVLGSTAVLLFPRLFSVLDHYRYFSQLLIAFRMMALDLISILVLIIISCSGFLVAFTLSFKKDLGAPSAAYALFQMLMGFTPAAWDIWGDYNALGKTLLVLFLFICHFLIVTILITVLTNSFMAVVQNANEEHQFLFAVNTISMVKSDALFSYIAPTNIIGWLMIPLKYCMSFRRFIRMNRTIIKITHIPILFSVFAYERLLLSNLAYGPTDLVEQRGRQPAKLPAFGLRGPTDVFSPGTRLREPSITTFHKDRALDEVFRRPFRDTTVKGSVDNAPVTGRRNSSNVVTDWMKGMGNDEEAFPPQEDNRSVLDRLETRKRPGLRRTKTAGHVQYKRKHPLSVARSVASDPDNINDLPSFHRQISQQSILEEDEPDMSMEDLPQQTDADGDDELLTNDEEDRATDRANESHPQQSDNKENRRQSKHDDTSEDEFFRTPMTVKPRTPAFGSSLSSTARQNESSPIHRPPTAKAKQGHNRNLSTTTVLFSPTKESEQIMSRSTSPERRPPRPGTKSGTATPGRLTAGQRTPKRPIAINNPSARPRPILPPRDFNQSNPNIAAFFSNEHRRRNPSFNARALDLASDLGDNRPGHDFGNLAALPASFTTQLDMMARARAHQGNDDESNRMSRIMLARMTTLEEGFRDVLKEVKGLKKGSEDGGEENQKKKGKGKKKSSKKDHGERMGSSV